VFVTDEVINTDARKSVVMFEPLGVVLAGINAILFAKQEKVNSKRSILQIKRIFIRK